MSFELTLRNTDNSFQYEKNFTEEEWGKSGFKQAFAKERKKLTSFWSVFIIPVRVNTLKNFSKDLFLPLTVQLAFKVNKISVQKILIFSIGFVLDFVTCPIRILTALPWKILAPKKENGDLYKFLLEKEVPKEILKGDYVKVKVKIKEEKTSSRNSFLQKLIPSGSESNKRIPLLYVPYIECWIKSDAIPQG